MWSSWPWEGRGGKQMSVGYNRLAFSILLNGREGGPSYRGQRPKGVHSTEQVESPYTRDFANLMNMDGTQLVQSCESAPNLRDTVFFYRFSQFIFPLCLFCHISYYYSLSPFLTSLKTSQDNPAICLLTEFWFGITGCLVPFLKRIASKLRVCGCES